MLVIKLLSSHIMPKITVVIPNYNHARFLDQRIQSILEQTYQDFELLYLDDASTDDSNAVFAKYVPDPRIRSILNQTNGGSPFPQWNKGVCAAKGDYIWIAESDDFADPRMLEVLVKLLNAHPNVGVAYCQSALVDVTGQVFGSAADWTASLDAERWNQGYTNSGQDECAQFLLKQCTIPNASAVLFRKSVYQAAGGADEDMHGCGDWLLWTKMLLRSDVAFVPDTLNFFRKHQASTSQIAFKQGVLLKENYRIVRHIVQNAPVTRKDAEAAYEGLMSAWLYYWRSAETSTSKAQRQQVIRQARQTDRKFFLRMLRRSLRAAANKSRHFHSGARAETAK